MQKAARFGKSATWIGMAAFVLLCRSALADTSVRFKIVADRVVVVPVLVNDQGPFDFVLDTGTNTTVVDLELAQQLGLRPIDRVSVTSPAGVSIVPRAQLQSLTLGPKTVEGLEVLCADLGGIRRLDRSVHGMLGQQFLSRFNYLLSYKDRRLEFVEPEAAESRFRGVPLSFDSDEGRILVAADAASSRAKARRFILDSGASDLVLFDRQSRGLGSDVEEHDGTVVALTSHDSLQLRTGSIRQLVVGGQRFDDLPVILVRAASSTETRPEDGLLPTNLFRAVYFNNREGFVLLNPSATH